MFAPEIGGPIGAGFGAGTTATVGAVPGKAYNPFDILLPFGEREFGNHWFGTGTPIFLTDMLLRRRITTPTLEGLFEAFFAGIPNERYARTGMVHYASVFYSHFAAAGMDVRTEESGSRGRADMAVLFNANVYVFEFKLVEREPQGLASARIRERGYADKYRDLGWPIHPIGVEFGREERNIVAFSVETARTAEYPARPSSATAPPSCAGPHHPPG